MSPVESVPGTLNASPWDFKRGIRPWDANYKTLSSRGVVDSPRVLLRLPLLRPQLRSSHYRSPSRWRSLVLLIYSEVGLALSTPRFALIGGQNPMFGLLCLSAGLCFLSVGLCFGLICPVPVSTTAGCS